MPGHGSETRQHGLARTVYTLKMRGDTTKEIARILAIPPERVKTLAALGERLASVGARKDDHG